MNYILLNTLIIWTILSPYKKSNYNWKRNKCTHVHTGHAHALLYMCELYMSGILASLKSTNRYLHIKTCVSETGGRFKNTYELLNLRALKISILHKNYIFQCMGKIFCVEFQRYPLKFHTKYQCMGKIFCVEFQRYPLKFHTKYLTHTLKYVYFIHRWKFKSS